jgi:aspartyl/glutamyl-tRNA(Asn/Gln) amidotransferase C subunit
MAKSANINQDLVKHVAQLANIPLAENDAEQLTAAFIETLKVVDQLQALEVKAVEPSHQVTGLTNAWRQDEVKPDQMFSQEQALANAPRQHQGYFVVEQILKK